LGWLLPFRAGITVAGAYLRLTGPLDYANHAAMILEAAVPLLLVAGWLWWRRVGQTAVLLLTAFLLLLLLQASFLTLSRASFLTIGGVAGVMALLLGWRQPLTRPWLALVGAVGLLFAFNSGLSEAFRLRLGSEGDSGWYLAEWQVPPDAHAHRQRNAPRAHHRHQPRRIGLEQRAAAADQPGGTLAANGKRVAAGGTALGV
jgi:hypothetical protein